MKIPEDNGDVANVAIWKFRVSKVSDVSLRISLARK